MFEIKYDKNGMPIRGQEPEPMVEQQAPVEQAPVIEEAEQEQVEEAEEQDVEELEERHIEKASQQIAIEEKKRSKRQDDSDENIKKLREKSERMERERDEAIKFAREIYEKTNKPAQPQQPQEKSDEFDIAPDDFVEGKHLNKYQKEVRELKAQLQQFQQKSSEAILEAKLKSQYPDFDSVVSAENVESLRGIDSDIVEAIQNTPDLYKKASLAYKMIKKFGIVREDNYQNEREIAKKNAAKPKSLHTVSPQQGNSPLSSANAFANGLTKDLQAQLRKEMEEARRNS